MPEVPHDATVALRLELGRMTDKANALEAALKTDVLKVAKVAIYQASIDAGKAADADTIGCMGVEVDDLKAENARLNAVIESHNDAGKRLLAMLDEERRNSARLKAEVERLKSLCDNLGMGGKHTVTAIADENARLKAEVERLDALCKQLSKHHSDVSCENVMLRKAGDALQVAFLRLTSGTPNWDGKVYWNWHAAKEGKQP